MKRVILAGLLLAVAPIAALSAQNWNTTFAGTDGGHRVGNPDAAKKLIAFVSYSCPHCASFERQADAPLRVGFVETGRVSMEVRHVIRNPIDLAATLITTCGPEDKFWGNHRAMFRDQERWLQVAVEAAPSQTQRWMSGAMGSRMRAIASDLDFYELMETRGYTVAQLDQCLSDEAAARAIATQAQADNSRWEISGTPSFAINGTMLEGVHNWSALQPALESRGR